MAHEGVAQGTLPVLSSQFPELSYVIPPGLSSVVLPILNHPAPPPFGTTTPLLPQSPHL